MEIVLSGGEDLRVRLLDEDEAVPGATLNLHASVRAIFHSARQTDEGGIALWKRTEPGRYQVQVRSSGFWPTWHAIELEAGGGPIDVDALRLGDLVVRAQKAEGAPLPGFAVALRSLDLGESAASWVEERRIHARPEDLRTDARGELRLLGIPRGAYVLGVQRPTGEWIEQELRVPGGRALEHRVVLD